MVVIFRSNSHYTKGIECMIDRKINFYNKAKSRARDFIQIFRKFCHCLYTKRNLNLLKYRVLKYHGTFLVPVPVPSVVGTEYQYRGTFFIKIRGTPSNSTVIESFFCRRCDIFLFFVFAVLKEFLDLQ